LLPTAGLQFVDQFLRFIFLSAIFLSNLFSSVCNEYECGENRRKDERRIANLAKWDQVGVVETSPPNLAANLDYLPNLKKRSLQGDRAADSVFDSISKMKDLEDLTVISRITVRSSRNSPMPASRICLP
jgi:hypothetical protein